MMTSKQNIVMWLKVLALMSLVNEGKQQCSSEKASIVYSWSSIQYDWPNASMMEDYNKSMKYIQENNIVAGIRVYKGDIFVVTPKWRNGVPSSLNRVVMRNNTSVFQPFPNWDYHASTGCEALQYVQAIEIDPNTGYMWMVDTGRVNYFAADGTKPQDLCQPKIIIYDLNKHQEVKRYVFPSSIVSKNTSFINDIVLDYYMGEARFAYLPDTFEGKLIVYDAALNKSYYYQDPVSMAPDLSKKSITINGVTVDVPIGINGIAMSPDFRFVYYGSVAGITMYQVPTYILRKEFTNEAYRKEVRKVGDKPSQSDGMAMTVKGNLYFGALTKTSLYKWNVYLDSSLPVGSDRVLMKTVEAVACNNETMQWIDTIGVDEQGILWFTASPIQKFLLGMLDFSGKSGPNFYILRMNISDMGYLYNAKVRTSEASNRYGEAELMYNWPVLDFDWTNEAVKKNYTDQKLYIPENNPFTGIKVYKRKVYINVPRWRKGVPSSLNVLLERDGKVILKPFPNWEMQKLGDCNAIQFSQSMEIDPNTGWMWIIDTGRINIFSADNSSEENYCPGKLIIYDINNDREIRRYVFPASQVDPYKTFLNDIVLEYIDGVARNAYITDTLNYKLIKYDFVANTSHVFDDPASMKPEPNTGYVEVNNKTVNVSRLGINGIAMSADFKYLYYSLVSGFAVYQVPTSILRNNVPDSVFKSNVQNVGTRSDYTDGMLYTLKGSLYYPALSESALYRWDVQKDLSYSGIDKAKLKSTNLFYRNSKTAQWIDTLGVDDEGYIWFTAPAVQRFLTGDMNFTGKDPNFYIWRVFMDDKGYLSDAKARTDFVIGGASKTFSLYSIAVTILYFISGFMIY
ncbi:hypothetical protein CHS0354_014514 [Potamilus streckersoni]|uniref:Bee-milk protein n=1 Tax=Potamilus streckersoni TaxID=2493646 RepID=A0AAE0S9Z6_9BIVA|nr:hypothetical protein CHS0354_014514 [Potamilus streckersoni]